MGRPSKFNKALGEEIISRLSTGEPLTRICRDEHMPAARTVSDWKKANEAFSADFARARDEGFDAIAADCLDIADNTAGDTKVVGEGDHERTVADTEWITRSKLRVETRLKLLAKWDPKRYGDKVVLTGGDPEQGDKPIQHAITVRLV